MNLVLDHQARNWRLHNFEESLTQPRHRWYPFKEGFSPVLVRHAISSITTKTPLRILDPFSGSGTTPLTAGLMGHNALAIEVNPFCAFITSVKCLPGKW